MAKAKVTLLNSLTLSVGGYRFLQHKPVLVTGQDQIDLLKQEGALKVEMIEEETPAAPKGAEAAQPDGDSPAAPQPAQARRRLRGGGRQEERAAT